MANTEFDFDAVWFFFAYMIQAFELFSFHFAFSINIFYFFFFAYLKGKISIIIKIILKSFILILI